MESKETGRDQREHERRMVEFLARPSAYPHPTGRIAHRETHVSHVFLAGLFAYKLKKPVTFPFLDASTLSRRKRFCRLELTLNRRLAPRVYLGLVPISDGTEGLRLGRGAGRVIEWVVKMRRLPEERMLDRLIAKGAVGRRDMEQVATILSRFFRQAARRRGVARYGRPSAVRDLVLGNLNECQPFIGALLTAEEYAALERAYTQYLTLQAPLLARRVREGRIIDGHGDLRCENICLTKTPAIFDCVEFEPAFRGGDMAGDLGFLAMDLEFRGEAGLARVLVEGYRRRLGDRSLDVVLPFYECHRSLVRAKVRGFAWQQHPQSRWGRRMRRLARRHVQLARRYAGRFAPPRLVVVGGLIGSGKSTLAKALAEGLQAVWLRTDEIRLTEFAEQRRVAQDFAEGLYAPRVSALVYQRLIRRAEALVREGRSVVCDGTFSLAAGREALRRVARRHGASFHFIECVVPRAVALARVARRYAARADLSEAKPEHYDRLRAGYDPVRGWPRRDWTRLSDNRPPDRTYRAALAALRRAWSEELGGWVGIQ